MKRLAIAAALAFCLVLSGCGYAGTVVDKHDETEQQAPMMYKLGGGVYVPLGGGTSTVHKLVLDTEDGYREVRVNTDAYYSIEIGDYYDGRY